MACTHAPHEVKRRHGMEYLLILTLWSKGAELPMKLQSEGFFRAAENLRQYCPRLVVLADTAGPWVHCYGSVQARRLMAVRLGGHLTEDEVTSDVGHAHPFTSWRPMNPPCRTTRLSFSTASLAVSRGSATGPSRRVGHLRQQHVPAPLVEMPTGSEFDPFPPAP